MKTSAKSKKGSIEREANMTKDSKRSQRALKLFSTKYNCAQSVYAAGGQGDAVDEDARLAVAAPFGGGVARQGEICGALTGALMALGEAAAKEIASDPEGGRRALYAKSAELIEAFRAANGGIRCSELTGCVLATEEGMRRYEERNLHATLCTNIVSTVSDLLDHELEDLN